MPTTVAFSDIANRVNLNLNEDSETPAWQLGSVGNATPTLTPLAGLALLATEEMDYLCRRVLALNGTFTAQFAAAQWCARYDQFAATADGTNGSTALTGAKMWWPRSASVNGVPLKFCSEQLLSNAQDPNYQRTAGVTTHFYRREARYLGVWPVPMQNTTVSVDGLYIPPSFAADGSGTIDWLDPAMVDILVDGTSLRAMTKNTDSEALVQRLPIIKARYDAACLAYWQELPGYLRNAQDGPYKTPAVMVGGK